MDKHTMYQKNGNLNPIIFTQPGTKLGKRFVTITPRGGFLFSAGFVHEEKLTKFQYAVLAYDENSKAVLFSFTIDPQVQGAIKITHRASKNSSLQSGSFFTFFHLDPKQLASRYDVQKRNLPRRGEWYVIFLNEDAIKKPNKG